MFNNNLCVSCETPINPDKDNHIECDKCNALMCIDNNTCVRNHLEYDHGCGYTNRYPIQDQKDVVSSFKGLTPSFTILDDPLSDSYKKFDKRDEEEAEPEITDKMEAELITNAIGEEE